MAMALPIGSEPQTTTLPAPQPPQSLRNPLPLSASQEAQVLSPEFAKCAQGRTFTVAWSCRVQQLAMNSCMIAHATKAEEDGAREDWFAGVMERKRKKEEESVAVEKRRVEIIELTRRQEEKEKAELELKKAQEEKNAIPKKSGWFGGR
ncbi:hypothetical protein LTR84_008634 [Exophiala bonariae]|uniref:COX assembly mitochondrial protein n=1 Tax=Exophiala bonariae TaxID=1690606 RepID=A0AAV9MZL0_9EURO|nr:hypothetical protein LTR84_008634 [Exophiala bonariae]